MRVAMNAQTGQPVRADGEPIVSSGPNGNFLHVLPRLWLPYDSVEVTLVSVTIPELDFDGGDLKYIPSRPYPNGRYVVFGSMETKLGFFIPLKDALPKSLSIEYMYVIEGEFKTAHTSSYLEAQHIQVLDMQFPEVGSSSYSTERCMPLFISHDEYRGIFEKKYSQQVYRYGHPTLEGSSDHVASDEDLAANRYDRDLWELITNESLSPLHHGFVHATEYEEFIPFRDKGQSAVISAFNAEHEKNAVVVFPLHKLLLATKLAIRYPINAFPSDQYPASQHPAMKMLCNWWNDNEKVLEDLRVAQSCQIFVRMNNDDEYHDVDLQVPTFQVSTYHDDFKKCSARIGEHFILLFMLGNAACEENGEGWAVTKTVDGNNYEAVGMPVSEIDVGYETVSNMAEIPTRYSKILNHYRK